MAAARKRGAGTQPTAAPSPPQEIYDVTKTRRSKGGRVPQQHLVGFVPTKHQAARARARKATEERATEALTVATMPKFAGKYTAQWGAMLGAMVADGCTLDQIGAMPNTPSLYDLLRWINDTQHPFSKIYYDAKQLLVPLYEERAQTAAATPLIGRLTTKRQQLAADGAVVTLTEEREVDNVERSKLIVNTLQWSLSHLAPKKHGRNAAPADDSGATQLEALFSALKSGPATGDSDG